MSQNFTPSKKEVNLFPSMMSFKEYYMGFVGIRDPHLANGWGWFVDIELNAEPIRIMKPVYYSKPSQYITVLKPIKEYPSIRSMKSMKNLHDTSMIFEMDDDDMKHRTNNYNYGKIISHTLGVVGIIICYFMTC